MSIPDEALTRFAAYLHHMVGTLNNDPRNEGDRLVVVVAATIIRAGAETYDFSVTNNCNAAGLAAAAVAIRQKFEELIAATERAGDQQS